MLIYSYNDSSVIGTSHTSCVVATYKCDPLHATSKYEIQGVNSYGLVIC